MRTVVLKKENIGKGHLVLVNREHPFYEDFIHTVQLVSFNDKYRDIYLEAKTNALLSLLLHSIGAGDRIIPVSGYRTSKEQKEIYTASLIKNGSAFTEKFVALRHNAMLLQNALPQRCKLMAVVKANAYGHGDIAAAKALNQSGIRAFAVATLEEAIHLRENGVKGEILILGYTNPKNIACLVRYRLTQTVFDLSYARALNAGGKKVNVHLKIDTGMHRLGLDYTDLSGMESIFGCKNLNVTGVFSHLCVSDSLAEEAVSFTNTQIQRFYNAIACLERKGYATGKIHIQSSYGILNYPHLSFDYARAGIVLYGVMSRNNRTRIQLDLQPVLSVKARIASVKQIKAGESVSYGREFTAKTDMKIATVTIGYADGIPSNYSEAGADVLLHSERTPIIGRICMDQLVIDVTHMDEVNPDDVVTLIGTDGTEQIRCEEMAEKCGMISNEILSRLGSRLNRVLAD